MLIPIFDLRETDIKALIDKVEFICKDWEDPEAMGVKEYVLLSKDTTTTKPSPMLQITQFDPASPSYIRLPLGTFEFTAEIIDVWGARTVFNIADDVYIIEPTIEERILFEDEGIKEKIKVKRVFRI